jgi:reactive chlorine resistance protein C
MTNHDLSRLAQKETDQHSMAPPVSVLFDRTRIDRLATVGSGVLRYGLVALLLLWGTSKFFEFEAQAIRPLVANHPLMSWMYPVFGVGGTSAIIGAVEIVAVGLICLRRFRPGLSALGSFIAVGTFVCTLSFLFTTPGALAPDSPIGGFLVKDVVLLGAALYTAAEALKASAPNSEHLRRG